MLTVCEQDHDGFDDWYYFVSFSHNKPVWCHIPLGYSRTSGHQYSHNTSDVTVPLNFGICCCTKSDTFPFASVFTAGFEAASAKFV